MSAVFIALRVVSNVIKIVGIYHLIKFFTGKSKKRKSKKR